MSISYLMRSDVCILHKKLRPMKSAVGDYTPTLTLSLSINCHSFILVETLLVQPLAYLLQPLLGCHVQRANQSCDQRHPT